MRAFAVLSTFALAVALSACGPTPSGSPTSGTSAGSTSPPTGDQLVISVKDGSGRTTTWRLTCDPPGGTHPDPEAACQALEKAGATALRPVPKGLSCTQVYGGPETAVITGTWRGQAVSSRLSRINGCEISRWNALEGLLPKGGA